MENEGLPRVGSYTVLAPLGGRVSRSSHRTLGGDLVVSRLPGVADVRPGAVGALERLDHPHVARVHEVGLDGGALYVVTDYIEGEDVGRRIASGGPLPVGEAVRLGQDVAGALAHLHEHGLVHGRLRPESVVRRPSDGSYVVADVGEALRPESGGDPDARADLVGLGALLYTALTGRPAPESVDPDAPPRVGDVRDDVPGWLDVLVARSLLGDPEGRYSGVEGAERAFRNAPPLPETRRLDPAPVMEPAPVTGSATDGDLGLAMDPEPVTAPEPVPEPAPVADPEPTPPRAPLSEAPPQVRALAAPPAGPAVAENASAGRAGRRPLLIALGVLLVGLVALGVLAATRDGDAPTPADAPTNEDLARADAPPPAPPVDAPPPPEESGDLAADLVAEQEAAPALGAEFATPERGRLVADAYLETGTADDRGAIARLYTDRVRYYDRGAVSRDEVLADKAAYLRRWPDRRYDRVSDVTVEPSPGGGARVRFDYTFQVSGPGRSAEGEGWAELTVLPDGGDGFRIVGEDGGVTRQR